MGSRVPRSGTTRSITEAHLSDVIASSRRCVRYPRVSDHESSDSENDKPTEMTANSDHCEDSSTQDILDIDPQGDVILIVGPTKKKLRVSSSALSFASSVLRAMLNSKFLEGTITSGMREISLPDDDAEAFTIFCNIAHMRAKSVEISSFSLFERLSVLCDKYDATEAAMPWSTVYFLQNFKEFGSRSTNDALKMLHVAYAFDNAVVFAMVSKAILGRFSRSKLLKINGSSGGYEILPAGFLEAWIAYHESIMRNLHREIETVLEPYIKEMTDYAKNGFHPYEVEGKPEVTATGRSLFNPPPSNSGTNSRSNGSASGFFFGRPVVGNSFFGNQNLVPTSNPPALAVPPFGVGASASTSTMNAVSNSSSTAVPHTSASAFVPPAAANRLTNIFAMPTAVVGGSNLFSNPSVSTANHTANSISSTLAGTTNSPNPFAPTNVTGTLFGNTGTTGGGLFGTSNTTGGNLFGPSGRPGGGLPGPYTHAPICKGKEKLGSWLLELSRAGLWPFSMEIYNSSYRDIVYNLITFPESPASPKLFEGILAPGSRPPCKCHTCNANLSELISEMSKSLLKEIRPLCLICVKDGKFTIHEGNCASQNHVVNAEDRRERSSSAGSVYNESDFVV